MQPIADLKSSVRIGELVRLRVGLAVGVHGDGGDFLLHLRTVIAVGLDGGDGVHHVHAGGHLAEGGVLAVQVLGVGVHDEELRSLCAAVFESLSDAMSAILENRL